MLIPITKPDLLNIERRWLFQAHRYELWQVTQKRGLRQCTESGRPYAGGQSGACSSRKNPQGPLFSQLIAGLPIRRIVYRVIRSGPDCPISWPRVPELKISRHGWPCKWLSRRGGRSPSGDFQHFDVRCDYGNIGIH